MPRWPIGLEIGPGVLVSIVLQGGLILTGVLIGDRETRHHDAEYTTLEFEPEFILVELTANFVLNSTTVYDIGTILAVNLNEIMTIGRP